MPYKEEHACRLRDPKDLKIVGSKYRSSNGKKYRIIFGIPKGKKKGSVEQAYRYPKDIWSEKEAKQHCEKHGGTFEAAKKEEISMNKLEKFIEQIMNNTMIWKIKDSEGAKQSKLQRALKNLSDFNPDDIYIAAIFQDVVVIYDWENEKYFAIEYSMENDDVVFGKSQEVELVYIPAEIQEHVKKNVRKIKEKRMTSFPEITDVFYAPCITEEKNGTLFLRGMFAEADVVNQNGRIYPKRVLEKAVISLNEKFKIGLDSHPPLNSAGSYRDVALKFIEAWMEGNKAYCRAKVLETAAGKDLKIIAEEDIPIGLSMRGYGEEKYDEEKKANVVQDNYILIGIDAVLEPAFEQAKAIREQKEGGSNMENLKKQIAELVESINTLSTKVEQIEKKGAMLTEEDRDLLKEAKAQIEKEKAALEAKKKISEIMESEELKDFKWKDILRKHLEKYESVEEVEKEYPRVLETLQTLTGENEESEPVHVQIEEKGIFGAKKYPKSVYEAYQYLLDPFKDTGIWEGNGYGFLDNPRRHAKIMLDNYLKYHMAGTGARAFDLMTNIGNDEILRENRRNPLYYLTEKGIREAIGDTEAYTGDVAATAAALLPLYWFVMQDVMDIVNEIVSIQALSVPTGKIFFGKEYYGDGAGTWSEISANFSRTKGQKAEGATPQYLKIKIESNDISLETALKFIAPWTKEVEQDLLAYHGINLDSINIQMARREVMREISHQILYKLLTGTSYSKADNCIQATGSPLTYPLLAPAGYSQAEWERVGLTKAINQGSALIRKSIWEVKADNIICDSDYEYLFQESHFTAADAKVSGFGFDRIGTFNKVYKVWTTGISEYDKKILLLHRGSAFFEAPFIFMPYILFYIGDLIPTATLKNSRSFMSRFAMGKVIGKKIVIIDIND
ncbi:MAG TPA: hypothetical protein ENI52_03960 [Thermoplasmata archaeon]|nr:hypothetical protein [Thermoplasmata archaeon]